MKDIVIRNLERNNSVDDTAGGVLNIRSKGSILLENV
jgi:hypothetical protein